MQKCIYGKRVTFFDNLAQKCEIWRKMSLLSHCGQRKAKMYLWKEDNKNMRILYGMAHYAKKGDKE